MIRIPGISARTQFVGSAVVVITLTTVMIIGLVIGLATPALEDGGSPPPQPGPNVTGWTYAQSKIFTKMETLNDLAAHF